MPVTTSSTETSALPCHLPVCRISEFLAAAFASNRRFRDLFEASHGWWMRERRAGWGVLRVRSEYSCRRRFPNLIGPQDLPTVLLAGTGWVGDPVGPAHRLTPAAPCTGMDAQRCIGRRASENAESSENCSTQTPSSMLRPTTAGEPFYPASVDGRRSPTVFLAGGRRYTLLRAKATLE